MSTRPKPCPRPKTARWAVLAAVCLAAILWITAAIPAGNAFSLTLKKKNGSEVTGTIDRHSYDDNYVELRDNEYVVMHPDGARPGETVTVKLNELTPMCVYHVYNATIPEDDADARLKLGEFCQANNLIAEAEREYRRARDNARDVVSQAQALLDSTREAYARRLYEDAERATVENRTKRALDVYLDLYQYYNETQFGQLAAQPITDLQRVLGLPEELPPIVDPNAEPADDGDGDGDGDDDGGAAAVDLTASDRRNLNKLTGWLEEALSLLEAADRLIEAAIEEDNGRGPGSVLNDAKNARDALGDAKDLLEGTIALGKPLEFAHTVVRNARLALARRNEQMVRLALHMTHYHLRLTQLPQATQWCNRILAIDYDHEEALSLRAQITEQFLEDR